VVDRWENFVLNFIYIGNLGHSRIANNCFIFMVGAGRFERPTPCAQGRCATRLRYAPTFYCSPDSKTLSNRPSNFSSRLERQMNRPPRLRQSHLTYPANIRPVSKRPAFHRSSRCYLRRTGVASTRKRRGCYLLPLVGALAGGRGAVLAPASARSGPERVQRFGMEDNLWMRTMQESGDL
jgi:hypothetical protein